MWYRKLGGKLIISVGLILIISIGIFAIVSIRDQENQLLEEVVLGANRFSDTVVRSTRYDMLKVQREDVHRIIESIGDQKGIELVRIFNKEGLVMFSTDKSETHHQVDMEAEACYVCHAAKRPLEKLPTFDRTRIYYSKEGHRVMGMITGIYNEPDCYNADCHAHPKDKTVLGVLDIVTSLEDVDKTISVYRSKIIIFALLEFLIISTIIGVYIHRSVITPISKLLTGIKNIASGDLSHRIYVRSSDEFSDLAHSFNTMTKNLDEAKKELTNWAKTLEEKVEERTRQLQLTREQLIHSEKQASLGRLAAGVAHEINNPLTGVLTYSSLLYDDSSDGSPEKEDLKIIIEQTKRCREIIKDLLDFARQNKPMKKKMDINDVIEGTLAVLKYQALFHNIEIVRKMTNHIPAVEIDVDQFQQVFLNIILNAAEAMPEGGSLTIETKLSAADDYLEIIFTDTGTGIKKEHLAKLFDPFFTTKEIGKGTGLGLAVSYGIVQRHGGNIEVKSTEGAGSTFTVKIPTQSIPD